MKTAVIDSSAIIALAIENDAHHETAVQLLKTIKGADIPILLIPEVLSEALNLLGKMQGRAVARATGNDLLAEPSMHLADGDTDRFSAGLGMWEQQRSGVSYTDCLVMATADVTEKKAGEKPAIFGFDEVFGKNGYALPEAA